MFSLAIPPPQGRYGFQPNLTTFTRLHSRIRVGILTYVTSLVPRYGCVLLTLCCLHLKPNAIESPTPVLPYIIQGKFSQKDRISRNLTDVRKLSSWADINACGCSEYHLASQVLLTLASRYLFRATRPLPQQADHV